MDLTQQARVTGGIASPMVFMGKQFWTQDSPVVPLLVKLAKGRDYEALISVHDDEMEAVEAILKFSIVV
jgi:hypothetical protein